MLKICLAAIGLITILVISSSIQVKSKDNNPEIILLKTPDKQVSSKKLNSAFLMKAVKADPNPDADQPKLTSEQLLSDLQASLHDYAEFKKYDFKGFFENYEWSVENVKKLVKLLQDSKAPVTVNKNSFSVNDDIIKFADIDSVDISKADPDESCKALRNSKVAVSLKIGLRGEVLEAHYDDEQASYIDPDINSCVFATSLRKSRAMEYVVTWTP